MLTLSLTIAMAHIVTLMSLGPDFFFASQTTVNRPRKEAMMDVLSIICGVMIWAGVALLSLHLIIEKTARSRTLIMVGDGLYLYQIGYQMLHGALKKEVISTPAPQVELAKSRRSFLKGLSTNLANPKAVIYFGPMFSLFVGDNVGTTRRWGIFALIIVETLVWFTAVASLFVLSQMRRGHQRPARWIDGSAGMLFAGFGIHLIIPCQCQMRHRSESDKAFTPHPTLFSRMPRRCQQCPHQHK